MHKKMFISRCICPPLDTNAYLVACTEQYFAAVIDPGFESLSVLAPILEQKKFRLSAILLTHSHWDHIAEVAAWQENYGVEVYVHSLDIPNLQQPGKDQLPMPFPIRGCSSLVPLHESQEITIGNEVLSVMHTPGHSPGGVCFYNASSQILFSGDTLFRGTIGNISFPTSVPQDMWNSLRTLAQLPLATTVYPGHGETTTLAAETWLPQAEKIFGT